MEAERERQRLAAEAEAVASTLAFSVFADRFIDRYAKIEQSKTWRDTDSIFRRDFKEDRTSGINPFPQFNLQTLFGSWKRFTSAAMTRRSKRIRPCE